jgi:oligopeptide/dipeptide ABC transporter ATP-binding protein
MLLELSNVSKSYSQGGALARERTDALRDVSLALGARGPEIFAVVGESGSGKSTLARLVLNSESPDSGTVCFEGHDTTAAHGSAGRRGFMARVQPIFQNPFEAFNPLKTVDRYLYSTAAAFKGANREDARRRADDALRKVGLSLDEVAGRFAHELSGGQLQRIAIARALIPEPALIVADEPVSMVDASLRMSIVELFRDLRDTLGVSIIYITHDLATAYHVSDSIIILLRGHVVERGDARRVLAAPAHPYTQRLRASVLEPEDAGRVGDAPVRLPETPEVAASSPGCATPSCCFSGRCPHVFDRCRVEVPPLISQQDERVVRCFLYEAGRSRPDAA